MKTTDWNKDIPDQDGWYWLEFFGKKHRQKLRRPVRVMTWNKTPYVNGDGIFFTPDLRTQLGFKTAKFGPRIKEPK